MSFAFSYKEIIDIIIITAALGFIFMMFFTPRRTANEWLASAQKKNTFWHDFLFAAALIAPAILLHEFGHKFTAMGFGLSATFEAAYLFLGIGLVMRLLRFPFIFFVPAYTSIMGNATVVQNALIAFAGPGVNLILWIGSLLILKYKRNLSHNKLQYLALFRQINMFLFIFNMIPIPGFDGYHVFSSLFNLF